MRGFTDPSGPVESHIGIPLPEQKRPAFQPVQPHMKPPLLPTDSSGAGTATGGAGLPFLSFDTSSAPMSFMPPPVGALRTSGFFEDESPLLEELGINTSLILRKTIMILNPIRVKADLHENADLSGPFIFFLLFGLFQLLAGKFQFGVILGWLAVASFFLYVISNFLEGSRGSLDLYCCLSFVGYCLLPMVLFSALSLFIPRAGPVSIVIACFTILWCTRACTSLLVVMAPHAEEHRNLLAYACVLIYSTFSLLVLF